MYFQPFTSRELTVKTCDRPVPETGVSDPLGDWELGANVVYVKTCCHPEFCPAASVAYPYTPMFPTNVWLNVIFGLTVISPRWMPRARRCCKISGGCCETHARI